MTKRVPVREYDPSTAITVSAGLSQAAVKPPRDAAGRITSDTRTSNAASLTHTDRIYLCRRGATRELTRGQATTETGKVSSRLISKTFSRLHLIHNFH